MQAHGACRIQERAQVGPLRVVDRRRHRHDVEVGRSQLRRIAGEAYVGRGEIGRIDRTGPVHAPAKPIDPFGVDVEADDSRSQAECGPRRGSPDVAETDDGDRSPVSHRTAP